MPGADCALQSRSALSEGTLDDNAADVRTFCSHGDCGTGRLLSAVSVASKNWFAVVIDSGIGQPGAVLVAFDVASNSVGARLCGVRRRVYRRRSRLAGGCRLCSPLS